MNISHGFSLVMCIVVMVLAIAAIGLWARMKQALQGKVRPRWRVRHGLKELIAALVFLAVLDLVAPIYAQTVYSPNFYKSLTVTLTNGQTLTFTNTALFDTVRPNGGEGAFIFASATNTTSAVVTAKFDVTPDGTNYTTTSPFALSVALNSTTQVGNFTNFPASGSAPTMNNVRKVALTSLANAHTNSVTVTVWLSHSNT